MAFVTSVGDVVFTLSDGVTNRRLRPDLLKHLEKEIQKPGNLILSFFFKDIYMKYNCLIIFVNLENQPKSDADPVQFFLQWRLVSHIECAAFGTPIGSVRFVYISSFFFFCLSFCLIIDFFIKKIVNTTFDC